MLLWYDLRPNQNSLARIMFAEIHFTVTRKQFNLLIIFTISERLQKCIVAASCLLFPKLCLIISLLLHFSRTKRCTCHDGYLGTGCQISWEGYASSDTWVTVWNHTDDEDIVTNLIGHAGCYVEPYLWVFGGYNLNRVFGHLLRYNFSQNNWEIQHSKTHPTPRYYHTVSTMW